MKSMSFLILLTFLDTGQSFAQISSFCALWNNIPAPKFQKLSVITDENSIRIQYEKTEIIIHNVDIKHEQLIEITEDEKPVYSFFSKYIIDPLYLDSVYYFQLSSSEVNILLTAYRQGTSGLSANMTFGILFDINKRRYQNISTWGKVENNFRDIDNDGTYEYICIDVFNLQNGRILVLNIFKYDDSNMFSCNLLLNNSHADVYFLETNEIRSADWKQMEIKILKKPDVFDFDKYQVVHLHKNWNL
jgi:hypothetical protein